MELVYIFLRIIIPIGFSVLALGIGLKILSLLRYKDNLPITISLSFVSGLAVIVNIGVLLGLVGQFKTMVIYPIFLVIGVLVRKELYRFFITLRLVIPSFFKQIWQKTPLLLVLIGGFIGVVILLNYLATFIPPLAADEAAYHLPEAELLATSHTLAFPHGGHYFYGNLPLFMEVLSAIGMLNIGYILGHVINYFIYLSLILFIYGWLRRNYNIKVAVGGIVAMLGMSEMLSLSLTGYVDTAAAALTIIGILMLIDWLHQKNDLLLIISGICLGIGIAIKYTVIIDVALMSLLLTIGHFYTKERSLKLYFKRLMKFFLPIILVGGFWYIKNMVLYLNPFYPLYFGHQGIDDTTYQELLIAIQWFGYPRTFTNYLLSPVHIFWTSTKQIYLQSILTLVALPLLPWLIIIKKYRLHYIILIGYSIIYSMYWFFFATHQERFLYVPNMFIVLLAVLVITQVSKSRLTHLAVITVLLLTFLNGYFPKLQNVSYLRKAFITTDPKPKLDEHWVFGPIRLDAVYFLTGKINTSNYFPD